MKDDNVKDYGYCSGDKFAMYLMDKGMVDTRAKAISKAMTDLNTAVCDCDTRNRIVLLNNDEWLLKTVIKYAKIVGNSNDIPLGVRID